jgi:signal transduction histidine kinase
MTHPKKRNRRPENIPEEMVNQLADSILELSEEELLAEERASGTNPAEQADYVRTVLSSSVELEHQAIVSRKGKGSIAPPRKPWSWLHTTALGFRFFSRFRSPISPGEIRRIERWLATARMFLAISALVAGWMDPSELGNSVWVFLLLSLYIVHGLLVMILLRVRNESTASFRWLVHGADILWPVVVALFVTGHGSLLFLFFFFVLGAAAYRWGLQETFGTAIAIVTLLWVESFAVQHGLVASINVILERHNLPLMGAPVDLVPQRLFMLSIYLVVMGMLLGYLAEQQKQLLAERAIITRVLGRARVEDGLARTLQDILAELLQLYGARQVLIASQESDHYRVFVGSVQALESCPSELHWLESSPRYRESYLGSLPGDACLVVAKASGLQVLALDSMGRKLKSPSGDGFGPLAWLNPFQSLASVSFKFGSEWWGRIFLFDPLIGAEQEEELRFLQELVRQVGPAVYNVYLVSRLRQRIGAVERARIARELHDGAVQSLIAVEMQVDLLKRRAGERSTWIALELERIQVLLREEILKLRELMHQMKSHEVDSRTLLPFLTDAVERFQRETGISARFVSELDDVVMPQRVCRELARIVQEGVVNVRKHSKAHRVLVRLASDKERWQLTIEDDGQGFPFAGRFSQDELEAMGEGPLIIRERVRLIDGDLTLESNPNQGARLGITVPRHRHS